MNMPSADQLPSLTGVVFNIQHYCTHDGPGIRTTVFLKGCPLHCAWCHNPESQSIHPEIVYVEKNCICCGQCVQVCPTGCHLITLRKHTFNRTMCTGCGRCVSVCPTALDLVGKRSTVEEIMEHLRMDRLFYGVKGGLTISGGEPLHQPEFAYALLKQAKSEGYTTAVETSGMVSQAVLDAIHPYVDWYLYDYKDYNPERFARHVGCGFERIQENLMYLDTIGARIILRCPIIPLVNNDASHFHSIAQIAEKLKHIERIEIEPGHSIGESKHAQMGYHGEPMHVISQDQKAVNAWIATIQAQTDKPVVQA